MKVLVTGVCGQLGYDVVLALKDRGHQPVGTGRAPACGMDIPYVQLDITDEKAVEKTLREIRPDGVIHCAAWTAVDDAEDPENREKVYAANVLGPTYLAKSCAALSCKLLHISTDYVLGGEGETPWQPEDVGSAPQNVYGQTKLEGEQAVRKWCDRHFIVRIAWVFGKNGNNFVKTMLKLAEKYDTLRVVNDQMGTPTYTADLARLLCDMVETEKYGTYHATNSGGFISWYDFACEIFRQTGKNITVTPVTTEEYGLSKAKRPKNSRLSKEKLTENGFAPLPHWQDALARYLKEVSQ